jgi:YidC/Oxa1 family membrane protein insertase
LLEIGYHRLEKIYRDHKDYLVESLSGGKETPCIVIAPSGHEENIVSTCASELVSGLLEANFIVVFRPHPMTIYRKSHQIQALFQQFGSHENFNMDLETESETYLHKADVLISDWSGVALEYAFGTERPVLFIDLPRRQQNPEYDKIDIPPVEVFLRDKIGKVISVKDIPQIERIIIDLIREKQQYCDRIRSFRSGIVYNFGHSSEIGADYIMRLYEGEACNPMN